MKLEVVKERIMID